MLRDINLGPCKTVCNFDLYHCIIYISRNSWIGFDHRNADFYD